MHVTALLTFACLVCISECAEFHTSLIIDDVLSCPEEGDVMKDFDLKNISLTIVDEQTLVNGNFVYSGEVPGEPSVKVVSIGEKCKHKSLPATCEKMFDFQINNLCKLWRKKGQIWTKPLESVTPPLDCRIKNDVYTVTNGTLDEEMLRKIIPDAEKYYWKLKVKIFYNNELQICGQICFGFPKFPGKKVKKH
ncbi:uncharacterized protein LOC106666816 [Cimex lectularius]|uniref:Uncharacterized protein n=1 Tax=Cimex lectularius TaxID=79782 RepID=A0A8I6THN6_CIMLE|nr:uncharacterized protein LOC106666816 [Cimex lectularius]